MSKKSSKLNLFQICGASFALLALFVMLFVPYIIFNTYLGDKVLSTTTINGIAMFGGIVQATLTSGSITTQGNVEINFVLGHALPVILTILAAIALIVLNFVNQGKIAKITNLFLIVLLALTAILFFLGGSIYLTSNPSKVSGNVVAASPASGTIIIGILLLLDAAVLGYNAVKSE